MSFWPHPTFVSRNATRCVQVSENHASSNVNRPEPKQPKLVGPYLLAKLRSAHGAQAGSLEGAGACCRDPKHRDAAGVCLSFYGSTIIMRSGRRPDGQSFRPRVTHAQSSPPASLLAGGFAWPERHRDLRVRNDSQQMLVQRTGSVGELHVREVYRVGIEGCSLPGDGHAHPGRTHT